MKTSFFFSQIMILILATVCASAKANELLRIVPRLKMIDDQFEQGTIQYTQHTRLAGKPPTMERLIEDERQNLVRQRATEEQVQHEMSSAKQRAMLIQKQWDMKEKASLLYEKNNHYALSDTITYQDDSQITFQNIFDGSNVLAVPEDGKSVSIIPDKPWNKGSMQSIARYAAGANFVYGRGLSMLCDPKVTEENGELVMRGTFYDGSAIRVLLDKEHDYLATRIERSIGKRLYSTLVLSDPKRYGKAPWVASKAVYESFLESGRQQSIVDFALISASFKSPAANRLDFPITQGMQIVDNRLGTPAVFNKVTPGTITLDELLSLTRKQLDVSAKAEAANRAYEQQQARKKALMILIPITLLGTLGGIIILRRRTRNNAGNKA